MEAFGSNLHHAVRATDTAARRGSVRAHTRTVLAILVAVVVLVSLVSACGSGGGGNSRSGSATLRPPVTPLGCSRSDAQAQADCTLTALAESVCGVHIDSTWTHPSAGLPNTSPYELETGIGTAMPNTVKIVIGLEESPHQIYEEMFCGTPETIVFIPVRVWDALITVGADTPAQPWTLSELPTTPIAAASPPAASPTSQAPADQSLPATPSGPGASPLNSLDPQPDHTVVVEGLDGRNYSLAIKAADTLSDCSAHAYGSAVIAYLRRHPCGSERRILATVPIGGRVAVLSEIWLEFKLAPGGYGTTYDINDKFQQLERADGTGGVNDLLRDGHRVAGLPSSIPNHEAFSVTGQDFTTVVLDAWWLTGTTQDQDADLLAAEQALSIWSAPRGASQSEATSSPSSASPNALATDACQQWQHIERTGVSQADAGPLQLAAADTAAKAGAKWSSLAAAMKEVAGLPNTSLNQAQLNAGQHDSATIKSTCRSLGVTVEY